jgi:Family of unknown function (DUF5317)
MFILYAVLAGLVIGLVSGGSPDRLGRLRFRWGVLIALGMLVQVALFSTPLGASIGDAAPVAYIASNLMVLSAVAVNLAIRGLAIVLAGGLSNLLAIVANQGFMPVSADALIAMGRQPKDGYTNSALLDHVNLAPLTDVFAMPTFFPVANVFSIGDVLIGVGAALAIVATMHGRGPITDTVPSVGGDDPAAELGASAH